MTATPDIARKAQSSFKFRELLRSARVCDWAAGYLVSKKGVNPATSRKHYLSAILAAASRRCYSPPFFAGASLKRGIRWAAERRNTALPPVFRGGLIEAFWPPAGRRWLPDSPPFFAGASLKREQGGSNSSPDRHSPPFFAGASLKPGIVRHRHAERGQTPPRFSRGPH